MGFWRREDDLERDLRAQRPEPRRELVDEIASRIVGERRRGASRKARLGLAVALTAGMLGALGAFGGLSYAANGVSHAVTAAVHVITPAKAVKLVPDGSESSAMAQYKVALCFKGHTIDVDSHAVPALTKNGATVGPCAGGSFKPSTKLVVACFHGQNVDVAKSSVTVKKTKHMSKFEHHRLQQAKIHKLTKLGFKLGFCKKA